MLYGQSGAVVRPKQGMRVHRSVAFKLSSSVDTFHATTTVTKIKGSSDQTTNSQ